MERVCGKHFVSGWPSDDPKDVDCRPTLLMKGHSVDVKLDNTESARKQRASKRSEKSPERSCRGIHNVTNFVKPCA